MRFELQRTKLLGYQRLAYSLGALGIMAPMLVPLLIPIFLSKEDSFILVLFGTLLTSALLILAFLLLWYVPRMVAALEYQVEAHVLHVNEGVFTLQRKAIPLDRVTDIRLVQTLLMRWCGIWKIQVQTASVGQTTPEAILWSLENPHESRNALLTSRNAAVKAQRVDAAG